MKKIGLIINPIAGIGGKVGLKGSDGEETLKKALELGAVPESENKVGIAFEKLLDVKDQFKVYTLPGKMGGNLMEKMGFDYEVLGEEKEETKPEDTIAGAKLIHEEGVDLLVFAGGDGTARNIMDAVKEDQLVIGIPAGVKIHSAVFALNPSTAGQLLLNYIKGESCTEKISEVMDINEELFRENRVDAKLYGYLNVLNAGNMVQTLKSGKILDDEEDFINIADQLIEDYEEDTLYIFGTGSTVFKVMANMEMEGTLLGVDLVYNKEVIAKDVTEKEILEALDKYENAKIVVTIIGGQGYVFGRGNQQLSAKVLEKVGKKNIIIIATKQKMMELFFQGLLLDTGDQRVNELLTGYYEIVVGYLEVQMAKVQG